MCKYIYIYVLCVCVYYTFSSFRVVAVAGTTKFGRLVVVVVVVYNVYF